MKKQSVLVQRALIFTAAIVLTVIAVGLPVHVLLSGQFEDSAARERVLAQTRVLTDAAGDTERFSGALRMLEGQGGIAYLADSSGTNVLVGEVSLPDEVTTRTNDALNGYEQLGSVRTAGQDYVYAIVPSGDLSYAVVAMLPTSLGHPVVSAMLAGILGVLVAVALAPLYLKKIIMPVVKPLGKLRDVAVSVADGNLEVRANERAPGEIGELGCALNNVSTQLSRNMYSLIIERNRLKQMLNGLSEGIVAIDSEGRITHTNPALATMFTKQKADPHMPDMRMKYIPDKTVWEDFDAVLASGETITRNMTDRERTIRVTISPIIDELGTIAGAGGLFSDVTSLERLERTRREYVSNVSHELRTPLTAIRALVEPLKEGMVTKEEDRMRYYDIILREVMRLSRLINDQLELSRLQSGTLAIQKSRMTLDDLVYDVCDRYLTIAQEKGLALTILTDFALCPPVYANADRVEQLLIILVDNAIKYTESGGVSVNATWDDTKVILSVKDTGIGIEDEDLPYVFDRFYKVDKAHTGKGSGLGLSIAKELVKRMDEELWVTSEKGVGTEFSYTVHRWFPEEAQDAQEDQDKEDHQDADKKEDA